MDTLERVGKILLISYGIGIPIVWVLVVGPGKGTFAFWSWSSQSWEPVATAIMGLALAFFAFASLRAQAQQAKAQRLYERTILTMQQNNRVESMNRLLVENEDVLEKLWQPSVGQEPTLTDARRHLLDALFGMYQESYQVGHGLSISPAAQFNTWADELTSFIRILPFANKYWPTFVREKCKGNDKFVNEINDRLKVGGR